MVNISCVLPAGLGQGAYLGGMAGKLGGEHIHFPCFFFCLEIRNDFLVSYLIFLSVPLK